MKYDWLDKVVLLMMIGQKELMKEDINDNPFCIVIDAWKIACINYFHAADIMEFHKVCFFKNYESRIESIEDMKWSNNSIASDAIK